MELNSSELLNSQLPESIEQKTWFEAKPDFCHQEVAGSVRRPRWLKKRWILSLLASAIIIIGAVVGCVLVVFKPR
jgi:hypothetical protein